MAAAAEAAQAALPSDLRAAQGAAAGQGRGDASAAAAAAHDWLLVEFALTLLHGCGPGLGAPFSLLEKRPSFSCIPDLALYRPGGWPG